MRFKSLIFSGLGLLLWACNSQSPFVSAPFVGVENETIQKAIDASTGGVLKVGNGTEIHVPANAFVNSSGQMVVGEIQLSYTEIADPASIIISGIPLNYGGDNPKVMESAGMFDLSATSNGETLELSEGKSIRAIISSDVEGDQYDFFSLNEEGRTWDALGRVTPTPNPAIDSLNGSLGSKVESANTYDLENCFAFNYGYDLDVYRDEDMHKLKDKRLNYYTWDTAPAIKTLEKLLKTKLNGYGVNTFLKERVWNEITWEGKKMNPNLLLWQSEEAIPNWLMTSKKYRYLKLAKASGSRYRLQFIRSEYDNGWKDFVDFTTYVTPKMPLEELYSNSPEVRSEEYDALLAQIEEEKKVLLAQNKVLREFNISKMGVYNYDYIKEEERLLVEAEIYLDGKPLEDQVTDLFVVIKDQNSVLRYSEGGLKSFVIYPEQQLFAFMVADGNSIAMQKEGALDEIDIESFRNNEDQKLRINLVSSDYVINEPIDLTIFLNKEMKGTEGELVLSMK